MSVSRCQQALYIACIYMLQTCMYTFIPCGQDSRWAANRESQSLAAGPGPGPDSVGPSRWSGPGGPAPGPGRNLNPGRRTVRLGVHRVIMAFESE